MHSVTDDRFVNCPFDARHVMKSFRLPRHIVKCKEQHPEIKLKRCPFNWTHLFNDEGLEEHLKVCSSKSQIESSLQAVKLSDVISVSHRGSESDGDDLTGFVCKPLKSRITVSEDKEIINDDHGWVYYEKDFDEWKTSGTTLFTKDGEANGNDLSDEELSPLPLPKTTSKAFRIEKSNPSSSDWNWGNKYS